MSALSLSEPELLTNAWLAALALPTALIDPSHLLDLQDLHVQLDPISRVHNALWPAALKLGRQDLDAAPPACALLTLARAQLLRALSAFGLQLLAPGIRRVINGAQVRAIVLLLGDSAWRRLDSDNLQAGNSQPGYSQAIYPLEWDSVKHFGAHAPLIVATAWLSRRLRPVSPALWALLRLRVPTALLHEAEFDGAIRCWESEPGHDPLLELTWFRDFALQLNQAKSSQVNDER